MSPREKLQKFIDTVRPNRYALRPYLIRDGKKHPFAVICPGGAYRKVCSYVEGLPFARRLNERGYHAIVVYYRVREKAGYPSPQEDLVRAINEVLSRTDEWLLEARGWSLWGSSAGGHLAASTLCEAAGFPRPSALILIYPVVTMGEKTHAETRRNLLGEDPDRGLIERLSVEKNVTKDFPPTFVWYGTADTSVDPENSMMLKDALDRAAVPCEMISYEGVGHGEGLGEGTAAEGWLDEAVRFWEGTRPAVPKEET